MPSSAGLERHTEAADQVFTSNNRAAAPQVFQTRFHHMLRSLLNTHFAPVTRGCRCAGVHKKPTRGSSYFFMHCDHTARVSSLSHRPIRRSNVGYTFMPGRTVTGAKCPTAESLIFPSGTGATTVRSGRCPASKSVKISHRHGRGSRFARNANPATMAMDASTLQSKRSREQA